MLDAAAPDTSVDITAVGDNLTAVPLIEGTFETYKDIISEQTITELTPVISTPELLIADINNSEGIVYLNSQGDVSNVDEKKKDNDGDKEKDKSKDTQQSTGLIKDIAHQGIKELIDTVSQNFDNDLQIKKIGACK